MEFNEIENIHIFNGKSKRKIKKDCDLEENCDLTSLEKATKRVRITFTPGELRLQTDIKELNKDGIIIELTDSASSVKVIFESLLPFWAPSIFLISGSYDIT